jgi:transposase
MDIVHPRVAGIDVHKKIIWVAVRLPGERPGERSLVVKRFATFWRPLQQMAAWLAGLGVTDVAMESTGVYWWPVYHALGRRRHRGVRVQRGAHAQRAGPQDGFKGLPVDS